jgi:hypothetical protein
VERIKDDERKMKSREIKLMEVRSKRKRTMMDSSI